MKRYYGKETEAAMRNFPFSSPPLEKELVYAVALIKEAAARAWREEGGLDDKRTNAIVRACREVAAGKFDDQFSLPALQGGAGTSFHMNVNEVIAARANEVLRRGRAGSKVHPNDHVNKGQSTNDVIPSAVKIVCYRVAEEAILATDRMIASLTRRARGFGGIVKLGRTHLQDAVPTTLKNEFLSYAAALTRDKEAVRAVMPCLLDLNLGATAIGSSVNAPAGFRKHMYVHLRRLTRLSVKPARNLFAQTWSAADFCRLSSAFVVLALDASKMANDLRFMASGPRGGIGEIKLEPLQAGSSIMPGKVNPVMLEVLNQLYFVVLGNDISIREAAQASQMELSVMTPVIADRLISSGRLMAQVFRQAADNCIARISADPARCREHLERSMAYATVLVPQLGYDRVSALVKEAVKKNLTLREVMDKKRGEKIG